MAADTIDLIAQQQYENEIYEALQQKDSLFAGTTAIKDVSTGASTNIPKETAADDPVTRGGRHATIINTEGDESNINIPIAVYHGRFQIDKEDEWLTDANVRAAKINAQVYAANRKRDKLFVAAAILGASQIGDAAAVITKATLDAAREYADGAEWPEGDRFWAISPRGFTHLSNLASGGGGWQIFTSRDFSDQNQLVQPKKVFVYNGFNFIVTNRLTLATTERKGIIWNRASIGCALQRTPMSSLDWDGQTQSWMGTITMSMGYKTIDSNGVRLVSYLES